MVSSHRVRNWHISWLSCLQKPAFWKVITKSVLLTIISVSSWLLHSVLDVIFGIKPLFLVLRNPADIQKLGQKSYILPICDTYLKWTLKKNLYLVGYIYISNLNHQDVLFVPVLSIKPRASHMLCKCSTSESYLQLYLFIYLFIQQHFTKLPRLALIFFYSPTFALRVGW